MFTKHIAVVLFLLVFTFGCGGGSMQSELPVQNYSRPAYQNPNYHPYLTPSNAYRWENTIHVGGDVEPRDKLRRVGTFGSIKVFQGASRDGVGKKRLENYEHDLLTQDDSTSSSRDGFYPFRVAPKIWLEDDFYRLLRANDEKAEGLIQALFGSVRILNDALPPEFQIDFTTEDSPQVEGTIAIAFRSPGRIAEICGSAGTVACASSDVLNLHNKTNSAVIYFPDNLDTSKRQTTQTIILHELLHALGIQGHVDSIEFPDSLMGAYGDFFPNPGFVLHRIDREILQIMYMSQRTDDYNDWGEWSDTTLHITGESVDGHVNFGVALFNGLPQPWARGVAPRSMLSFESKPSYLFGSVSWKGSLLGFSGISPVYGETTLTVDMDNLDDEQDLNFRNLFFLSRFEESGAERWFPTRNIAYKVKMSQQGFYRSEDDGQIRGVFIGPRHEGMAGTLKRTDLVGAFGGKR